MTRSLALAAALVLFTWSARAATIVNGSMTDTGNDYNTFNTLVPTGWSHTSSSLGVMGSPDIFDANTNFGSFAWSASGDGGTFVHALSQAGSDEGVAQTIDGLVAGESYEIAFEQSISNRSGFNAAGDLGFWSVSFGSETLDGASMVTPTLGVAGSWTSQTLVFTATATSQELIFLAQFATGDRVDLGLDGVSLQLVPEPGRPALTALVLAAGALATCRGRRTTRS
jgi:hypothetical protein